MASDLALQLAGQATVDEHGNITVPFVPQKRYDTTARAPFPEGKFKHYVVERNGKFEAPQGLPHDYELVFVVDPLTETGGARVRFELRRNDVIGIDVKLKANFSLESGKPTLTLEQ